MLKPLRIITIACCTLLPSLCAQEPAGVHFETGFTWQQIQAKAKSENKYVFVDCFATWCGPCKAMDKTTYPDAKVGEFLNGRFVCVKVQMDKSKQDNEETKSWYANADAIAETYKVTVYPTFLFFGPDGIIVHRGVGRLDPDAFITLAAAALNPDKQVYTLAARYQQGDMDKADLPIVIRAAGQIGDVDLARTVERDYVDHHLNGLSGNQLLKKEYFNLSIPVLRSGDKIFDLCYHRAKDVDSMMGRPGYSRAVVDEIIGKEDLDPSMAPVDRKKEDWVEPDWGKLVATIATKYDATIAVRTVTQAKMRWFRLKRNWSEYTKNTVLLVDNYGEDMSHYDLATYAWAVFQHSSDRSELNSAVGWIKRALSVEKGQDAPYTDTYANLIYKLGKTSEAIPLEKEALQYAEKEHFKRGIEYCKDAIEKMQKGEPTWPSS